MLVEICSQIDSDFNNIYEDCIFLNPYATLYRYPQGDLMPSRETVTIAIQTSQRIFDFVKAKIQ